MLEQNFTCWYDGQDEGDGKDILAPNAGAAARMAVDIWRHENLQELHGGTLVVYLRDEAGHVSKVHVADDSSAREAHL
ncbi:MAG TPA: hypothetical protein VNJ08_10685 [Bacteriovoracaceae bacterium]|nr:hypothetical protein [Bacteriovoracaceae bacterium]